MYHLENVWIWITIRTATKANHLVLKLCSTAPFAKSYPTFFINLLEREIWVSNGWSWVLRSSSQYDTTVTRVPLEYESNADLWIGFSAVLDHRVEPRIQTIEKCSMRSPGRPWNIVNAWNQWHIGRHRMWVRRLRHLFIWWNCSRPSFCTQSKTHDKRLSS